MNLVELDRALRQLRLSGIAAVLDLYRQTIALTGPVSTLIEWDDEIPAFEVLAAEAERAHTVRQEGLAVGRRRAAGHAGHRSVHR